MNAKLAAFLRMKLIPFIAAVIGGLVVMLFQTFPALGSFMEGIGFPAPALVSLVMGGLMYLATMVEPDLESDDYIAKPK